MSLPGSQHLPRPGRGPRVPPHGSSAASACVQRPFRRGGAAEGPAQAIHPKACAHQPCPPLKAVSPGGWRSSLVSSNYLSLMRRLRKEPLVVLGHQQVQERNCKGQPQRLRPPQPCRRGKPFATTRWSRGWPGPASPASLPLQQRGQNTCQRWVLSPRQVWLGSVSSRDTRLPWILNCCVATLGFGLGQDSGLNSGLCP